MLFKFLATVLLVALGADARKHMKSKIPKGTTESITVAVYLNDDMCMDVNELGNMTITAVRAPQGSSQCEETMLNVGTPANVPEGPAFLETVLGGLGIKNHELFYEETTLWKNKLSIKAGGSCATAASNPSVSLPAPEHGCHAFPIPEEYLGMIATAVSAANITIFIKAKYMVN